MRGFFTHAARSISAACVFAIVASCGPRADHGASGPATVAFSTDGTGAPRFGEVNVYPLSREVLAEVESSRPSVDAWQKILAVRVDGGMAANANGPVLPLLGTYTVAGDTLRFRPRFPPAPSVDYTARFDGEALYARVGRKPPRALASIATSGWSYSAAVVRASTMVTSVYPSGDVLPMNLLRVYVEFSAPMSSGRSYEFVKLYAEGDSLLEEPFFTGGGAVELWDPEHTRLTILFDPGRIKRDLKPHEEMGLPLREGKRYRLVIDSAWRDAHGASLVHRYEKKFRVGPQDRTLVRTADWRVTVPGAGTRDPFVLTFPEPLDRALLARLLTVRDSTDARVDGDIVVSDRETRWAFSPREPWRSHPHALNVDTELEDLAGNNLRKLFDVAPGDAGATGVSAAVVRIPFQPK
jgi:hypothetical protein